MSSNNTIGKTQFNNIAPEDKEWSAHIDLLNNYTTNDMKLRHIIQYARSGPHFPADMHVDLIEQLIAKERLETKISVLKHIYTKIDGETTNSEYVFNLQNSIEDEINNLERQLDKLNQPTENNLGNFDGGGK